MKLEDWPIDAESQEGTFICDYKGGGEHCRENLTVLMPGGGNAVLCGATFGELARSIVEHAKAQHGIEIVPSGYWYQSFKADGTPYFDASDVDEFKGALHHFAKLREESGDGTMDDGTWARGRVAVPDPATLTYRRIAVYTLGVVEEWVPDGNA